MAANIILGTAQLGFDYGINNQLGKPNEESIFEILTNAFQSGIRTLDTADVYGDAIDTIGLFHRTTGFRFNINTKFVGSASIAIKHAIERSIDKMGVEKIETYFFHGFNEYAAGHSLMQELQKCKADKLINRIGVSLYTKSEFEMTINDPAIDTIQLPFNLLDNNCQRSLLLDMGKEKKKCIQARSVFLQGLLFIKPDNLPNSFLPLKPYLEKLRNICDESNLSMEHLCLQYANAQANIDEIIIGVDSKEQLMKNISSLRNTLPMQICNTIDEICVKETDLLNPFNWDKY